MAYTPQTWANGSDGGTPINAGRLNHMEAGIKGLSDSLQGATTETLLWENASPSSSFAAQTISLDLSGCSCVAINYKVVANQYNGDRRDYLPISGIQTGICYVSDVAGTNNMLFLERSVLVTTSDVTFGSGYYKTVSSLTSPTNQDIRIVPTKIYGIKVVS